MKVAVLTWGSRGDFQPYLALARGFARAGHQVRIGAPRTESFAGGAAEQGIPFTPLGPEPDPVALQDLVERIVRLRDPFAQSRLLFDEYGLPWLDQVYRECLELGSWSDLVVSHFFQLAGRMVAETLGRPWVSGTLAHAQVPSRYVAPHPLPDLGLTLNGLAWRLGSLYGDAVWGRAINRARRRVGLRPLSDYLRDGFYADLNLIGVSRQVAPSPPDWPPRHRVTGYWLLDRPDWSPPPELAAFVARDPKPVAIGFGSMSIADRAPLAALLARVAALSDVRLVLQSAFGQIDRAALPASIFLAGDVPHDWLFPRVAAVVHHGGAGTSAAAFRAGVPSVFVPHLVDQYSWAETARRLGVAPRPVPRRALSAERLARAIVQATRDGRMQARAARLGAAIRAEDGVGAAVRLVEEYADSGR